MYSVPLGSPTGPQKRPYLHAVSVCRTVAVCVYRVRWAGVLAGYGDWVGIGEGYTGYYPATSKAEGNPSEAGPEGLQGLEWWGLPAAPALP